MKDTDQLLEKTGEAVEYLKIYARQRADMVKLEVVEKSSEIVSSLITNLVVAILAFIGVLLLSLTAALFLGQLWGDYALGFLAITVFYTMICIVLVVFRRQLVTNPVVSHIISLVYEEK